MILKGWSCTDGLKKLELTKESHPFARYVWEGLRTPGSLFTFYCWLISSSHKLFLFHLTFFEYLPRARYFVIINNS